MGIENFFPKSSYCGEVLSGYSTGYPIHVNPEKRVEGTINGIARLMLNPNMTQEDRDSCLRINSERLGIDPEDLMAKVEDCMNFDHEGNDSDSLDSEEEIG